jgi:hypothetical protein
MKVIVSLLLILSLSACGNVIGVANLASNLISPSSVVMGAADYGLEKKTGKTSTEHAVSFITSKDCKVDYKNLSICNEDNALIKQEIITIQNQIQNIFKIQN